MLPYSRSWMRLMAATRLGRTSGLQSTWRQTREKPCQPSHPFPGRRIEGLAVLPRKGLGTWCRLLARGDESAFDDTVATPVAEAGVAPPAFVGSLTLDFAEPGGLVDHLLLVQNAADGGERERGGDVGWLSDPQPVEVMARIAMRSHTIARHQRARTCPDAAFNGG